MVKEVLKVIHIPRKQLESRFDLRPRLGLCYRDRFHSFLLGIAMMTLDPQAEAGSVFLLACENADISLARDMLRQGANPEARNDMHEAAIHLAVKSGDLAMLRFLLQDVHLNPDLRDAFGRTALHWAAQQGNIPMIEALLLARADINAADDQGFSPITYGERSGYADVVQLFQIVLEGRR